MNEWIIKFLSIFTIVICAVILAIEAITAVS